MRSVPLSLQTVYQDLVEARRALLLMEMGGKPFLKEIRDKGAYWYARQRVDATLGQRPDLKAVVDGL